MIFFTISGMLFWFILFIVIIMWLWENKLGFIYTRSTFGRFIHFYRLKYITKILKKWDNEEFIKQLAWRTPTWILPKHLEKVAGKEILDDVMGKRLTKEQIIYFKSLIK